MLVFRGGYIHLQTLNLESAKNLSLRFCLFVGVSPFAIFLCGKKRMSLENQKKMGKKNPGQHQSRRGGETVGVLKQMIPRPTHRGTVHHAWPMGIRPGCTSYSARRITWRRTPSAPTKLGMDWRRRSSLCCAWGRSAGWWHIITHLELHVGAPNMGAMMEEYICMQTNRCCNWLLKYSDFRGVLFLGARINLSFFIFQKTQKGWLSDPFKG